MRDSEMYKLRPTKGEDNFGLKYIAIDAVQNCTPETCPVAPLCVYAKNPQIRCSVERKYLEAVVKSIQQMVGKDITQMVQNKITLHLLPLFQQLVRFQIEAYSVRAVTYTTPRGDHKVHPIFKEIRDTIKSIEATQRSLGIDGEYIQALELTKTGMRRVGQERQKGLAETDFRDRWDEESFATPLNLRDPDERPRRSNHATEKIESETEDARTVP